MLCLVVAERESPRLVTSQSWRLFIEVEEPIDNFRNPLVLRRNLVKHKVSVPVTQEEGLCVSPRGCDATARCSTAVAEGLTNRHVSTSPSSSGLPLISVIVFEDGSSLVSPGDGLRAQPPVVSILSRSLKARSLWLVY